MATALPLLDDRTGIYAFDAGYVRPLMAAIHLIVDDGRVAIVDTASNAALSPTLGVLSQLGLTSASVDYVVLTHVHLDHAGGAGAMMAAFPNARLIVHPRGARHMADPGKLYAAVEAVYGAEEARTLYGQLIPVPAERIIAAADGQILSLGHRQLEILHTPGHAKHHICLFDHASRGVFTGDVLGLSYRELDVDGQPFLFPTTSPSQFDPDEMRHSVDAVMARDPEALYLTHYSRVVPTPAVMSQLRRLLEGHLAVALGEVAAGSEGRERRIRDGVARLILAELRVFGCALSDREIEAVLAMDLDLNAQGLNFWLDHRNAGA